VFVDVGVCVFVGEGIAEGEGVREGFSVGEGLGEVAAHPAVKTDSKSSKHFTDLDIPIMDFSITYSIKFNMIG
jgi:hypothetical protein